MNEDFRFNLVKTGKVLFRDLKTPLKKFLISDLLGTAAVFDPGQTVLILYEIQERSESGTTLKFFLLPKVAGVIHKIGTY